MVAGRGGMTGSRPVTHALHVPVRYVRPADGSGWRGGPPTIRGCARDLGVAVRSRQMGNTGSGAFGDVTGGSDEAGTASRESGCARDLGAGSGESETNPKPRAV
jgi:hypothetical protein